MDNLIYLGIIILAVLGIFVATHIFKEKKKKKPLICSKNFKCDSVVRSKYSKLFGAPVELFGIFYYILIIVSFSLFLFRPSVISPLFIIFVFFATGGAFLFSIYLTFIQTFKIKEFCSWCLSSAVISSFIFFLVLASSRAFSTFISMAVTYKYEIMLVNWASIAVGLFGFVFFWFLRLWFGRDLNISEEEGRTLHVLWQAILLVFAIILFTGGTLILI